MTHLDRLYGLPSGTLTPKTNLTPTVPIFFIKACDRGDRYALSFASDLQARIASCMVVIKDCQREIHSLKWTRGFNPVGIRFGDKRFAPLPSYKT